MDENTNYFYEEKIYTDKYYENDNNIENYVITFKTDKTCVINSEYNFYDKSVEGKYCLITSDISNFSGDYEILEDNEKIRRINLKLNKKCTKCFENDQEITIDLESKDINMKFDLIEYKLKNKVSFSHNKSVFIHFDDIPLEILYKEQLKLMQKLGKSIKNDNLCILENFDGNFQKYLENEYPAINFEEKIEYLAKFNIDLIYQRKMELFIGIIEFNGDFVQAYGEIDKIFKEVKILLEKEGSIIDPHEILNFYFTCGVYPSEDTNLFLNCFKKI
jgi:hypothetical protein